jgi:ADP-ribose pyrophosphatase YjhB (NUDIX family)
MPPPRSHPVHASFPSEKLTLGAGAAIFHLASSRVVVCYHPREKYHFLPKGRRNANEETTRAAEREGFEESGYRNRVLPLPFRHSQPDADEGPAEFVREPLWTQLLPLSGTRQYLLFWYVAETVSAELDERYASSVREGKSARLYIAPPPYPDGLKLADRVLQDVSTGPDGKQVIYEPMRHEGTGVDEDELLYESYLLPIEEACQRLKGSVMEDVIRRGWAAIQLRLRMESSS